MCDFTTVCNKICLPSNKGTTGTVHCTLYMAIHLNNLNTLDPCKVHFLEKHNAKWIVQWMQYIGNRYCNIISIEKWGKGWGKQFCKEFQSRFSFSAWKLDHKYFVEDQHNLLKLQQLVWMYGQTTQIGTIWMNEWPNQPKLQQ